MKDSELTTHLHYILARADETPNKLAFDVEGTPLDYKQLKDLALGYAASLRSLGIEKGHRCGMLAPTSPELIGVYFGIQFLGAIPCLLNHHLPTQTTAKRINQIECHQLIGTEELLAPFREAGVKAKMISIESIERNEPMEITPADLPAPDDISHFQVTSGTSGEPRAAILTYKKTLLCVDLWTDLLELKPDRDVFVGWVPLYHDLGLIRFIIQPIQSGVPCYLMQATIRNFRPWLETISRVRGTVSGGPDFAYRIATRMVKTDGLDLSSWKFSINGGEPARLSTIKAFEKKFGTPGLIRPGYGLAEYTLGVSMMLPGEELITDAEGHCACGRAFPGVTITIVDEDGNELPPNTPGEIVLGGEFVFLGYYNDPESTQAALRDGKLFTGDQGKLDERGYIYVLGRTRAMIKRSGALIAPREIEEVVDQIPGVRLSAALAIERGVDSTEDVAVLVEIKPDDFPTAEARNDLRAKVAEAVKSSIGSLPAEIFIAKPRAVARSANGKIRHAIMRRQLAEGTLEEFIIRD